MIVESNGVEYEYVSTIVKREYLYDGQCKDITYFVLLNPNTLYFEEIDIEYCKAKHNPYITYSR